MKTNFYKWIKMGYKVIVERQINYNLARRYQKGYPLFIDVSKDGEKPCFKAKIITPSSRFGVFFSSGSGDGTINECEEIVILLDEDVIRGKYNPKFNNLEIVEIIPESEYILNYKNKPKNQGPNRFPA